MHLEGKTALVTGSSRSLGKAIAIELAKEGANVIINAHAAKEEAQQTAEEIRTAYNVRTLAARADVSDPHEVKDMAQRLQAMFPVVDILVNNVGVSPQVPFMEMTEEDWHAIMGIHLHSFFYVTKAFIGPMVEQGWGRIVNLTGHAHLRGTPNAAHTAAGKGGVAGFTRSLATEFASDGITVNNVAPGHIDTPPRHIYYRDHKAELGGSWHEAWQSRIPVKRQGTP